MQHLLASLHACWASALARRCAEAALHTAVQAVAVSVCAIGGQHALYDVAIRPHTSHALLGGACGTNACAGEVLATYNDDDIYLFDPPGAAPLSPMAGASSRRAAAAATGPSSSPARGTGACDEDEDEEEDAAQAGGSRAREREGGLFGRAARRQRTASSSKTLASGGGGGNGEEDSDGDGGAGASGGGGGGDHVVRRYSGHRNNMTVKGVAFMGESGARHSQHEACAASSCLQVAVRYRQPSCSVFAGRQVFKVKVDDLHTCENGCMSELMKYENTSGMHACLTLRLHTRRRTG